MATNYIVFRKNSTGWEEQIGVHSGSNPRQAIGAFLASKKGITLPEGEYAAVPARSWRPITVKVASWKPNAMRIPSATFSCTVAAGTLKEMGAVAWEECAKFFGDQSFEITDLDTDALQTGALVSIGYTARVRARAV